MILTCPACDTKYVVKDGAIPPAGRQVRCASCKHSWHQEPETLELADEPGGAELGGPPEPDPDAPAEEHVAEVPAEAEAGAMIADYAEPSVEDAEYSDVEPGPDGEPVNVAAYRPIEPVEAETTWQEPDSGFVGYVGRDDDERPRRRAWPLLLGLVLLIVVAAAAFWYLAPAEWKARAGIAEAGATPLQLMITTSDRQPLESGNELVAISGRVINPTDQQQNVPPIHAELRNKVSRAIIHRWIIAPPARILAPRSSASFNSAEVDVPNGGDELTVTLGGNS